MGVLKHPKHAPGGHPCLHAPGGHPYVCIVQALVIANYKFTSVHEHQFVIFNKNFLYRTLQFLSLHLSNFYNNCDCQVSLD